MALTGRYINPLTDFGFKKLFGSEPNKDLLIDFLNQILPNRQISDLSYTSGEQQGNSEFERDAVFNLYCTGGDGERFIVEMQKAKQNYFKDRSVFYSSFPIQEQAPKGDWNFKLNYVYSVGILDFVFDEHKEDSAFYHVVELKDQRCDVFYDKLKYIYLELPKFVKTESELETSFDKWLYVLRHLAELNDRPAKLQERIFKRLFKAAEIAGFTPTERKAYEESLKKYRDLTNVVNTARDEGFEQGREEGREQGREEGREEGRELRSIEIARELKGLGVDTAAIIKATGLSATEIEAL